MKQSYIHRNMSGLLKSRLAKNPIVGIIGPRQCGKSTLAREFLSGIKDHIYLDLERPSDLNKLSDPEAFFEANDDKTICLDEIQRLPGLFPVLRWAVDRSGGNGRFIVLGSASPDLLRQSAESLAGRISYLELTPFLIPEVVPSGEPKKLRQLWLRGGFPRSFLSADDSSSLEWRNDFIRTLIERDIPSLGARHSPGNLERFWKMAAHIHGRILNRSKLGESLGVSHHTVQSYADLFSAIFMLRILPPLEANIKKRLIKSPKIYIRDSGILHSLLEIESQNDLFGHPAYGPSWEGFALENILSGLPRWSAFYYRTSSGTELDLVLQKGNRRIAVEFKASVSPTPSRSFRIACADTGAEESWIVAPVAEAYPVQNGIRIGSPLDLISALG